MRPAAYLLGVERAEFVRWLFDTWKPKPGEWSRWESGKRPLPEVILRLFAYTIEEYRGRQIAGAPPGPPMLKLGAPPSPDPAGGGPSAAPAVSRAGSPQKRNRG